MKYKDILKEFVNEHTKLSMKFSVSCKGVYAGDYDKALWKLIKKQLDSNTKRVKKESVEKLEEMKGAVIKGTGKKWLVEDYISRKQAIKAIK